MLWIVLILIIACIAALFWWHSVQERRWQREMTYLTRHENHSGEDIHADKTQQLITKQTDLNADQISESLPLPQYAGFKPSDCASAEVNADNHHFEAENQISPSIYNPENRKVGHHPAEPTLSVKVEKSPKITITEAAPLTPKGYNDTSYVQVNQPNSDLQTSVANGTHRFSIETAHYTSPQQIYNQADDASATVTAPNDDNISINRETSSKANPSPSTVDQNLAVITLEEATRRIASSPQSEEEPYKLEQLEVVQLSWQQKQQVHRQKHPRQQVNEITVDDPMLARVRSQTKAEQEALLKQRALKNYDPEELERATQHSLGHVLSSPSHLANVVMPRNLLLQHHNDKNIIDEEDIRFNLMRQRLARLRQNNTNRGNENLSSVPVIAEEEVFSNLAKTDSPVNKPKFQRPVVRESVIPAAARIGEQQAVQVMVPGSDTGDVNSANDIALERHVPLSTRFTPFYSIPEVHKPRVEVVRSENSQSEAIDNNQINNFAHETNPVTAINSSVSTSKQYQDTTAKTAYAHVAFPHDTLIDEQQSGNGHDQNVHSSSVSSNGVDDIHTGAKQYNMRSPQQTVNLTNPFQYIEDADEVKSQPTKPIWYLADDENEILNAEIAVSAGHIAQQLRQNQNPTTVSGTNEPVDPSLAYTFVAPDNNHLTENSLQNQLQSHHSNHPPADAVNTYQPSALHLKATLPSLELLLPAHYDAAAQQSEEALLENGITIEEKLSEFKVKVRVVDAFAGPVITRYEIEPAQGVRGSQVVNLEKDLARSLGFSAIRIVETIPGKTYMGIELPNPKRQVIRLSEILTAQVFQQSHSKLTLALGQGITGQPIVTDLAKAPHLLVAGTTGSGKSVGVNAMILSLLFKATPEDVRLIMIDPKMLELSIYEGIPHLLAPVVTDMKLAANALTWCVNEMEKRYRLMSHIGVRNLAGFNQKVAEMAAVGRKLVNPFSLNPNDPEPLEKLPYIVVVVDEFADLMMTAGKKIEELIARLAQKARAAGIHLILATQRPSVDVITGLIKANIPTRIAFQVSSKVDSRTILDQMGAENLLGQGDMLFLPPGTAYPERVHGAFVADEEVHRVVNYLKQFGEPQYIDDILTAGVGEEDIFSNASSRNVDDDQDPLYDDAVALVVKTRKASISSVQRHLRIGYNRAARLVEQMEAEGVVSAPEGNGNRTVLAPQNNPLDG